MGKLEDLEWRADCLRERMDAADIVDVTRIVNRLIPSQVKNATDLRAEAEKFVRGKLTRSGKPGEVDAVGYVTEFLKDEQHRRRYGDDAEERADAVSVAKMQVVKLEANRFAVTGVEAVIAGRQVNEPYRRVWRTKAEAERDAEKWDRINKEALADLENERKQRFEQARQYLVTRRERGNSGQMSLF